MMMKLYERLIAQRKGAIIPQQVNLAVFIFR